MCVASAALIYEVAVLVDKAAMLIDKATALNCEGGGTVLTAVQTARGAVLNSEDGCTVLTAVVRTTRAEALNGEGGGTDGGGTDGEMVRAALPDLARKLPSDQSFQRLTTWLLAYEL